MSLNTQKISNIKDSLKPTKSEEKYDIHEEVGRGGYGLVHRVYDKMLHRNLAIKFLLRKDETTDDEKKKAVADFVEEARITAQLEHPHIVPVHDMGTLNEEMYFTMKMVKGEPLNKIIKKIKKGDEEYIEEYTLHKRLIIFRKICDAISFAHSRRIIHRDIKPENVMVGEFGEVLLMDWGLSKFLGSTSAPIPSAGGICQIYPIYSLRENSDFEKTADGVIQGTPLYLSPEQASGKAKNVDHRSDIYLLGATLYHILSLYAPHTGKDVYDLLERVKSGQIIPVQDRNPSQKIPKDLQKVVAKSMAVRKKDRYQTVSEMCRDIDAWIAGEITSPPLRFRRGQFIMEEGEVGTEGYVILNGNVQVTQKMGNKDVVLCSMGKGDIVGEMAIISSQKRSASVITTEDTEVQVIDRQLMEDVLERLPPWMGKIIFTLVDRLRSANENVHPLMLGDCTYHVLRYLGDICLSRFCRTNSNVPENVDIPFMDTVQQISSLLSLSQEKVQPILAMFAMSELCQQEGPESFRLKDFSHFCHLLNLLHMAYNANETLLIANLPMPSEEGKKLVVDSAQMLSELIAKISLDDYWEEIEKSAPMASPVSKQGYTVAPIPDPAPVPTSTMPRTTASTPAAMVDTSSRVWKESTPTLDDPRKNAVTQKVKEIIKERLQEIQNALGEMGLTEGLSIKYAVEARANDGAALAVEGELLQVER